jgi:catechol 2,3-dioxygenase-like lactoylglutathione lyase family enzyme
MGRKSSRVFNVRFASVVCVLLIAIVVAGVCQSSSAAPQFGPNKGAVVGIAFDGRMVSDLDKSVAFYKLLGFTEVTTGDHSWHKDETANRIFGVKGVESRMIEMYMNSNVSGKPFVLHLRQFRGIKRRNVMAGKTPWEPGATHIEVVVPDSAKMWADLKAADMLWPRTWGGELIAAPGATKGTIAYITDPDGMDVEITEQSPARPAVDGRPARAADPPGLNHIGLVILDPDKIRGFYGVLLGEQFPATPSQWLGGDFMDSAVGGHGNIIRIVYGTFPEAADPNSRLRFEIVEFQNRKKPVEPSSITDIGVNVVGFEVTDLDDLLVRLKGSGAPVVSDGLVSMPDGRRVALLRDPDVGMFIELYEAAKK